MTVQRGVNDDEIGELIDFAIAQPCVRGVTIQPVQVAGRTDGHDPEQHRLTLTEVRRRILDQTDLFRPEDLIPVPCHPDALCMAYALKHEGAGVALTSLVDRDVLIDGSRNTIVFEGPESMRDEFVRLFSTGLSEEDRSPRLSQLLCCLPGVSSSRPVSYGDLFRVLILEFIDADAFDLRSIKKSCIHIAHPDGRIIPFDTYNLFYRDDLEQTRLEPIVQRRR